MTVDLLRRPVVLLWDHHRLTAPLAGQLHLSVPLAGGPPRGDAATRITRQLQQLWVSNPLTDGPRVTSVSASIVPDATPDAPAPHRLFMVLTYDHATTESIDGTRMAADLEAALQTLA